MSDPQTYVNYANTVVKNAEIGYHNREVARTKLKHHYLTGGKEAQFGKYQPPKEHVENIGEVEKLIDEFYKITGEADKLTKEQKAERFEKDHGVSLTDIQMKLFSKEKVKFEDLFQNMEQASEGTYAQSVQSAYAPALEYGGETARKSIYETLKDKGIISSTPYESVRNQDLIALAAYRYNTQQTMGIKYQLDKKTPGKVIPLNPKKKDESKKAA